MARVSPADVATIVEVDDEDDLDPFIEAANSLVTELCEGKLKADGVTLWYGLSRLRLIELWLSAYFYSLYRPFAFVEQVGAQSGSVREQTETKIDLGFNLNKYGQAAMRLDTGGFLSAVDQDTLKVKNRIGLNWLGRTKEERGCV